MSDTQHAWVELQSCAWMHEAQFVKSLLEAEHIEAFLPDEHTLEVDPGLAPGFGGVRVMVRSRDLGRARDVIAAVSGPPGSSS